MALILKYLVLTRKRNISTDFLKINVIEYILNNIKQCKGGHNKTFFKNPLLFGLPAASVLSWIQKHLLFHTQTDDTLLQKNCIKKCLKYS